MLKNKINLSKVQIIILIFACFVVLCMITNGTYAWLTGRTSLLDSRFTYGDIRISIEETNNENNNYTMLPGREIKKDPIVMVKKKCEDCWLFIQIDKSDNFEQFMTYELVDGWIALDDNPNVYYREVSKKNIDQEFDVIKDEVIKVKFDVTKEELNLLDENKNYPVFSVSAYAVQRNSDIEALSTASNAWLLLSDQE